MAGLPHPSRKAAAAVAVVALAGLLPGPPGPARAQTGPTATLVAVIDTSAWGSPDPAGLALRPATDRLLASDSEVDETGRFRGANLFEARRSGSVRRSYDLTRFTDEPTGVAVNPRNPSVLYVSDDVEDRIFVVRAGPDGRWGTADDRATSFPTRPFGCRDPEGLAFGRRSLFIADGEGTEVFRVRRRGAFDGAPPRGDDLVTRFDTSGLGLRDPEGVEFDPTSGHLFVVSRRDAVIVEVTLVGDAVRAYDLSGSAIDHPSGIAVAPGEGGALLAYVSDRGLDNAVDPGEDDGRIYVFSLAP
ncbi:MAG TPA: SdiA-regulated domain-containing protein [Actinomycetota bacterium]|nr:SdiA-regulated domain-containing protein [Actinomycetota bacterium]